MKKATQQKQGKAEQQSKRDPAKRPTVNKDALKHLLEEDLEAVRGGGSACCACY